MVADHRRRRPEVIPAEDAHLNWTLKVDKCKNQQVRVTLKPEPFHERVFVVRFLVYVADYLAPIASNFVSIVSTIG